MAVVLAKKDVRAYLTQLSSRYTIYAPVMHEGVATFDRLAEGQEPALECESVDYPVKKIFFPASETLLEFNGKKTSAKSGSEKILVFGLSAEDACALKILDDAFSKPLEDTTYILRRRNSVVVAIDRKAGPNSFSEELDLDVGEGCDMLMRDAGREYILEAKTNNGKTLLKNEYTSGKDARTRQRKKEKKKKIDLKKVSAFLELGPEQEIWHELAERCFACGVCAYVCPICHCFDIEDRLDLNGKTGTRSRCWDSCMLANFAAVAGDENFRGERHERIHNWYHHKFSRAINERGAPDCVGCGRCITQCPANIDIHEVLRRCEK